MDKSKSRQWNSWWNLLVVLHWVVGLALAFHDWYVDREIAKLEQVTVGTITAHEPANHDLYGYVFSVGGKSYSGWDHPEENEREIGERIPVYFDSKDPSRNALAEFDYRAAQSLDPVPLLMLGIGVVALLIFLRRRKGPPSP